MNKSNEDIRTILLKVYDCKNQYYVVRNTKPVTPEQEKQNNAINLCLDLGFLDLNATEQKQVRLTNEGYNTVELIKNDELWNYIKENVKNYDRIDFLEILKNCKIAIKNGFG